MKRKLVRRHRSWMGFDRRLASSDDAGMGLDGEIMLLRVPPPIFMGDLRGLSLGTTRLRRVQLLGRRSVQDGCEKDVHYNSSSSFMLD